MDYVKRELARGIDDWEQRLSTALVKSSPTDLVRRRTSRQCRQRRARSPQGRDRIATLRTIAARATVRVTITPWRARSATTPDGRRSRSTVSSASRAATARARRSTSSACARRAFLRAICTARSTTSSRYKNEELLRAVAVREAVRRRVSRRAEGADAHRPTGHRQDAPGRVGAAPRGPAHRRPRAVTTTRARCCKDIRNTYNPVTHTAEIDVMRPVMEAELLVLDDLGAERLTDWVEETMSLIVNTRYNERRATIFTSNYEDIPDEATELAARVGSGSACTRGCARCASFSSTTARTTGICPPNVRRRGPVHAVEGAAPAEAAGQDAGAGARPASRGPKERVDLKWSGGRAGS